VPVIGSTLACRVLGCSSSLGGRDGGNARLVTGRNFDVRGAPLMRGGPHLSPWQEQIAKETMYAHLTSAIAITDVARECRLSTGHFILAFGNTVGMAPYRWFLSERISLAKTLLSQSQLSLAEIALECGFGDQSHFTNTFVRHVGIAPGRWRRSARGTDKVYKSP
jgi:AraC family transcriptional regulator